MSSDKLRYPLLPIARDISPLDLLAGDVLGTTCRRISAVVCVCVRFREISLSTYYLRLTCIYRSW